MPLLVQGQQAVYNGQDLEDQMELILRLAGYIRCPGTVPEQPCFIPKYTGALRNLYGKPMRVDFYLWHPWKYPQGFVIDMKHQAWGGSACEKLPYTVLSLKGTGLPTLLLLIGGGFKPQALAWCEGQQERGRFAVRHHPQAYLEQLTREFL